MARRLESLFVRYRRKGDVAALGEVFDRTAPEVLRVAMHFARHPAEAEDLLQETFLTAIDRAEGYEADRPLVPWLIGILRNHARRHFRTRRRQALALEAAGNPAAPAEPWMDVTWTDSVARAVAGLPEVYRQVLVLRLQHGKEPAEIGLLLDRPPATVRSQIHRGLEQLRGDLEPRSRSRLAAVLPAGPGLASVRERVLTDAAQASTTLAATATLPLVIGGGLMVKKQMWVAVLLLAALGSGIAIWATQEPPDVEPEPQPRTLLTHAADAGKKREAPVLATSEEPQPGREATDAPEPEATTQPAGAWPPVREIPEDKGSVAGTIRFKDGTPLVGARVALWGSPCVSAETDAEGRYHIHADWVHGRSVFLQLGRKGQPDYLGLILSTEVEMRNGELVLHDLELEEGQTIASTVVDNRTSEPIENAKVTVRRRPHSPGQGNAGFGLTDSAGRFAFPYIPTGRYTVELEAEGYEGKVEEFDLASGNLPPEMALLRARTLVIQFENLPEAAVGRELTVDLSRMDGTSFSVSSKPTIQPDGTIRLDAPEAATYRMTIFRSSHLPRLERDVTISDGELDPLVWTLTPGARVEGVLVDTADKPIEGAAVSIGGGARAKRTDATGRFALPYVPAGTRKVVVGAGTASIQFGTVEITAGGTTTLRIQAPGSATVHGTFQVGDRTADRYGSILSFVTEDGDKEVASARVDAKGVFRTPFLPAGRYKVRAWGQDAVPGVLAFELGRGQTKDLGRVELKPLEKIPVRFLLENGEQAPRDLAFRVSAYDGTQEASSRMPSVVKVGGVKQLIMPRIERDSLGARWITGLTRGRHRLEINVQGYQPVTHEVDVDGETPPVAELTLREAE